jgi:hypothetical protein
MQENEATISNTVEGGGTEGIGVVRSHSILGHTHSHDSNHHVHFDSNAAIIQDDGEKIVVTNASIVLDDETIIEQQQSHAQTCLDGSLASNHSHRKLSSPPPPPDSTDVLIVSPKRRHVDNTNHTNNGRKIDNVPEIPLNDNDNEQLLLSHDSEGGDSSHKHVHFVAVAEEIIVTNDDEDETAEDAEICAILSTDKPALVPPVLSTTGTTNSATATTSITGEHPHVHFVASDVEKVEHPHHKLESPPPPLKDTVIAEQMIKHHNPDEETTSENQQHSNDDTHPHVHFVAE